MVLMLHQQRTIISAMNPFRYEDSYTEIFLIVWFEEIDEPLEFLASPFDCERHGKELWIRAMAGEFGPIEVIQEPSPISIRLKRDTAGQIELKLVPPRMLTHDR